MRSFSLFLMCLLCLSCCNWWREKDIQPDADFKTLPILSSAFDSLKIIQELTYAYQKKQKQLNDSQRILGISWTLILFLVTIIGIGKYTYNWKNKKIVLLERQLADYLARQEVLPKRQKPQTPQEKLYSMAERMVKNQKLYLNSELTLDELAGILKSNRSSLSACINQGTGRNFNQWINDFRIEYAQKLMTASCNLRELAGEVGFSSYNSFSTNFKERVGTTPKEYLSMHKYDNFGDTDVEI